MAGQPILVHLLNPLVQWGFLILQIYFLWEVNVIVRLVLAAAFVVAYILLIPNSQRGGMGSFLWGTKNSADKRRSCNSTGKGGADGEPVIVNSALLTNTSNSTSTAAKADQSSSSSVLIVSYAITATSADANSSWSHALAYRHKVFKKSVVMVAGKAAKRIGRFPLARLVLWLAGGLMPYTRGTLVRLLKRKKTTVVISEAFNTFNPATGRAKFALHDKGPYSAALHCGAKLAPALLLGDGTIVVGDAIVCEAIQVPTTEEVIDLAKRHATNLQNLAKEHKVELSVSTN